MIHGESYRQAQLLVTAAGITNIGSISSKTASMKAKVMSTMQKEERAYSVSAPSSTFYQSSNGRTFGRPEQAILSNVPSKRHRVASGICLSQQLPGKWGGGGGDSCWIARARSRPLLCDNLEVV